MAVKKYVQHDASGAIVGIALADETLPPAAPDGGGVIALAPEANVDMHGMRVENGALRALSREEQLLEETRAHATRDHGTRDEAAPGSREEQLRTEAKEHAERDRASRN